MAQRINRLLIGSELLRHQLLPNLVDYFRKRVQRHMRIGTVCLLVESGILAKEQGGPSFLPVCLDAIHVDVFEVIDPDGSGLIKPHIQQTRSLLHAYIQNNLPDTVQKAAPREEKTIHYSYDLPEAEGGIRTLKQLEKLLRGATKRELTLY